MPESIKIEITRQYIPGATMSADDEDLLVTAIEFIWSKITKLPHHGPGTRPREDLIDVIAYMMHRVDLLWVEIDPTGADRTSVLPMEAYKRLARFRWKSESPGKDFNKNYTVQFYKLLHAERAQLRQLGLVEYDNPVGNLVVAIRENCPVHRPLQDIIIGYTLAYEMLFSCIPMTCKRSPSWIENDQRYGFFQSTHKTWVDFRMRFGGIIEVGTTEYTASIPMESYNGYEIANGIASAEVSALNSYVKKVFAKCLWYYTSVF